MLSGNAPAPARFGNRRRCSAISRGIAARSPPISVWPPKLWIVPQTTGLPSSPPVAFSRSLPMSSSSRRPAGMFRMISGRSLHACMTQTASGSAASSAAETLRPQAAR